jgi:enoyl-CoA hydratase/carnithine racemase
LVDILAPADDLEQTARDFAASIAENAPLAVEATRLTVRGDIAERIRQTTAREAALQSDLKKTADFAEGVKSVAERRAGRFIRA